MPPPHAINCFSLFVHSVSLMSRSVVLSDGSHVQHSMLATQLNSHVVSNALRPNAVIRVTKVRVASG